MLTRRAVIPVAVTFVTIAAVAGVLAAGWTPTIPADAASAVIARTTLAGDVAPDPDPDVDPATLPQTPADQLCLDRIKRPTGWLDLCWQASREPREFDPEKDYYRLGVYGTLGGDGGTGVRWWVVAADLVGEPVAGVFEGWPDGIIEGPCLPREVDIPLDGVAPEMICGRTIGATEADPWRHTVTWSCIGCVLADRSDRGVVLYSWVAVAEGSIPAWDIRADFGD